MERCCEGQSCLLPDLGSSSSASPGITGLRRPGRQGPWSPPAEGSVLVRHSFGAQQDLTPDPAVSVKGRGLLSVRVERT